LLNLFVLLFTDALQGMELFLDAILVFVNSSTTIVSILFSLQLYERIMKVFRRGEETDDERVKRLIQEVKQLKDKLKLR
jgi:hypothetical protein